MKRVLIILSLIVVATLDVFSRQGFPGRTGPYLGQNPPGMKPELFAPGIVSTGLQELNSVFSPGGEEFYFCVRTIVSSTVFVMKRADNTWGPLETVSFAGCYDDIDVSISPDGKRLLFCSNRPISGTGDPKGDYDIWMCERKGTTWGEAVHLDSAVNSDRDDFYPVVSKQGTLYFNSQRAGVGTNDISTSKWVDGKFQKAEKLGPGINTEFREYDAFIAPDESFLVFTSERGGNADLYVSFRKGDGGWTTAQSLGSAVNGPGPEFSPSVSPDGKYLFFTKAAWLAKWISDRPKQYADYVERHNGPDNGSTNIWWVSARVIEELRPKE